MVTTNYYHIDRLTVFYKAPMSVFKSLYSKDCIDFHYFKMVRKTKDLTKVILDSPSRTFGSLPSYKTGEYHPRQYWIVTVPNNDYATKSLLLGEITFDENLDPYDKNTCFVFLKLDNGFLYHQDQGKEVGDYTYNVSKTIKFLENKLHLTCQNISYGEIACDVTFDPITRMIALFRSNTCEVIIKNKTVKDRTKQINNLHFEAFTSLDEFTKTHCRIHNNGKNEFYMYNKSEAIEAQKKDYIYDDYHIEPQPLWRMECRIDIEYSKNFLNKYKISPATFLHDYLLNDDKLPEVWDYYSRKFIRFKMNRRHIYNPLQALSDLKDFSVTEVLPTPKITALRPSDEVLTKEALATPLGNATPSDKSKKDNKSDSPRKTPIVSPRRITKQHRKSILKGNKHRHNRFRR